MGRARSISVVVPAYNEMGNLEGAVRDVVHALRSFDEYEVIIVNDGSNDGTKEVADRLAASLPNVRVIHHETNKGFSESYRAGLRSASMSYVTFVPGDHEVAVESVVEIFDAVGKADIVVPYHGTPWNRAWHRRILTWICTTQLNVAFGRRLKYYQGPAVYPTKLARVLPNQTKGFFFATEMLVNALMLGYSIVEVPLIHRERTYGQSKAVGGSNIVNAQMTILRLWWNLRVRGDTMARPQLEDETPAAPTARTVRT
ncbi:MAG: glycosyltransferase family 2 protein [Chloroflexi bacterium]|nr:glycosyltransferase family 2 protein [Chloroflexota bacterium]